MIVPLYFKNQLKNLQGAELKLAELQTKYSAMEKQNFELSEKVKRYQLRVVFHEVQFFLAAVLLLFLFFFWSRQDFVHV